MLQVQFLWGDIAFVCHGDEPDFYYDENYYRCLRNNLILGKTRRTGTSWWDVQFLQSKRLLVAVQDRRTACVLHCKNCTEEALLSAKLLLLFWLCKKCSDCTVYKDIYTQCITCGVPWASSLRSIILPPFLRPSIHNDNAVWLWQVLLVLETPETL